VHDVLVEYNAHLPLTIRQIFYRLVGAHDYPKTEAAYESLQNMLVRARRADLLDFAAIRDDGITVERHGGYRGESDFWDARLAPGSHLTFRIDRQAEQPQYVEVWSEAAGMVPLLGRAVGEYGIPVYSCGGFDSLTFKHKAACRIAARSRPTVVLQVGDHDPSGVSLFLAAAEDVELMVEDIAEVTTDPAGVRFERIAVTVDQVTRYDLPTAPAKAKDKRGSWAGGGTVQVEAFPPDVLTDEVRQAVQAEVDLDLHAGILERERETRQRIGQTMVELRRRLVEITDNDDQDVDWDDDDPEG
jgi:hypothetical protein